MIHQSPLPEVEIPDLPLTDYVLARAEELGDKPALIDGPSGRTLTYGGLLQGIRALAGGLVARGFEPGQAAGAALPEHPRVRRGLPRGRVRRRRRHDDQPDVRRTRDPPPAPRRRRPAARHRGAVPRGRPGGRRGHRRRGDLRHRRGHRRRPLVDRADGRAARRAGARRRERDRRAALLLRHDRGLQGRDADASQPGRQRGADAGRRRAARRRDDRGRAAVLPHLRHAGADELRTARGRHDRHAAALRPRAVPLGPPGVRRHPVVRRPADRRRDGQAPARGQLRHVQARAGLLGRGAAVGRAGPGGRETPRLRGGPGLRHDRAVTGLAHHARRPVQAGIGRRHRAQHRDAHRRPADGRRPRRRRRRRDLGARAAGHEGLPQQRAGHRRSRSTTRAGCAPATSGTSTTTATSSSSTGSRS